MFARLGAKAVFLVIALALVFSGALMIPLSIAAALAPRVGEPLGYAIAGAILLVPPLLWAIGVSLFRPRRPKPQSNGSREVMRALFAAVAKETPWIAVIGAGLAGAAEMFLNRHKSRK
jgi:hypothetical protein